MVNWNRFTPSNFEYDFERDKLFEHRVTLALMSTRKSKKTTKVDQAQIDRVVTSQAGDESAWEAPIRVTRPKSASLSISGELAARAAFWLYYVGSSR